MSKSLSQIRNEFRLIIAQQVVGESDFTDSEINGLANESVEYLAVKTEYPRDIVEIQAQTGTPVYNLPSDSLVLRIAYFGDKNIHGDIKRLNIIDEKNLADYRPSWLDQTVSSYGQPDSLVLLNRRQVMLSPTPDTASGATGKMLRLSYVYIPSAMTDDTSTPDLPAPVHSLIKFRMAEIAYLGKLQNPKMASQMAQVLDAELAKITAVSTKEIDQQGWAWSNVPELNEDYHGSGVVVL